MFDDIQELKPVLDYKKRSSKILKMRDFSKGFVKKFKIFHFFLYGKIGQENVFDDILEIKKAFLDNKNRQFAKLKN